MKRWAFLLVVPWCISVSTSVSGIHYDLKEAGSEDAFQSCYPHPETTKNKDTCRNWLDDMAEALNLAHERRMADEEEKHYEHVCDMGACWRSGPRKP